MSTSGQIASVRPAVHESHRSEIKDHVGICVWLGCATRPTLSRTVSLALHFWPR